MRGPTKTGTTIVGCLFKDGLILGADTRATEGDIVADPNCLKVGPSSYPSLAPLMFTSFDRFITSLNSSVFVVPALPPTLIL
jgi:hypothetical protein